MICVSKTIFQQNIYLILHSYLPCNLHTFKEIFASNVPSALIFETTSIVDRQQRIQSKHILRNMLFEAHDHSRRDRDIKRISREE